MQHLLPSQASAVAALEAAAVGMGDGTYLSYRIAVAVLPCWTCRGRGKVSCRISTGTVLLALEHRAHTATAGEGCHNHGGCHTPPSPTWNQCSPGVAICDHGQVREAQGWMCTTSSPGVVDIDRTGPSAPDPGPPHDRTRLLNLLHKSHVQSADGCSRGVRLLRCTERKRTGRCHA